MAMSHLELDNAIIQASQQLGYATIRPDQNRAIKSLMEGRDVLISFTTGSRKSLCFSLLPYAFDYLYKRVGSPEDSKAIAIICALLDLSYPDLYLPQMKTATTTTMEKNWPGDEEKHELFCSL